MYQGLPWWSRGQDSELPVQGAQVRSLVRELDPTCYNYKKPNALSSAAAAHQLNARCALPEATRSCSQPFLRAARPSPTRAGPPFAATPQPSLLGQCGSRSAEPCSFFWSFSPSSGDCTEAPVSPEPCLLGLEDCPFRSRVGPQNSLPPRLTLGLEVCSQGGRGSVSAKTFSFLWVISLSVKWEKRKDVVFLTFRLLLF